MISATRSTPCAPGWWPVAGWTRGFAVWASSFGLTDKSGKRGTVLRCWVTLSTAMPLMARVMPQGARLYSIEYSQANADIARRIWAHAGVADRLTVVVGTLGDDGTTIERLRSEFGFTDGAVDFVFIDHDKDAYLPDLERIVQERWLHPGSTVVADNVKFPGAPRYRAHLKEVEGKSWRTVEHHTHVEYQSLLKDLVLESQYLGEPAS